MKLNINTEHTASCSLMLPCASHFQLANLQRNLFTHLLICCEGSYSVPQLLPSFGQPSQRVCSHSPRDSCFPSITVTSSPPRTRALSCSFTAWNKTKLHSFFYHRQAHSCYDICKAPVVAWVFSKQHVWAAEWVSELNMLLGEEEEEREEGAQRDAHSEASLGHVPRGFCSARSMRQHCSRLPVTPERRLAANSQVSLPGWSRHMARAHTWKAFLVSAVERDHSNRTSPAHLPLKR